MQTERSIMKPNAELISIGNELLSGRTLNTHGRDLGAAFFSIGIDLMRDTSIGDDIDPSNPLHKKHSNARPSYLSAAGSVQPSMISLVMPLPTYSIVPFNSTRPPPTISKSGIKSAVEKLNAIGLRQALILEEATVLPNPMELLLPNELIYPKTKRCYLLLGPPNEFNAIIEKSILPELKINTLTSPPS